MKVKKAVSESSPPKRKSFSTGRGYIAAERIPPGYNSIPSSEIAKAIKRSAFKDDAYLQILTNDYEQACKKKGPEAGMSAIKNRLCDREFKITKEERDIFLKAAFCKDGDAIQQIVRANSRSLLFPFVINYMIEFIRSYRHDPKSKRGELKKTWLEFLPLREYSKNQTVYTGTPGEAIMKSYVEMKIKEGKKKPAQEAAHDLGVSRETQRTKAPSKKGPGRHKVL